MILPTDSFSTAAAPHAASARQAAGGRLSSCERAELADLVTRARDGDDKAQTELVRRYTHRISGYARLIIRQPDAVEDVVQLVFIKMFRRLGRLRDPASFESWLFRLARNTAVDFIRRRRCRPALVDFGDEEIDLPDPSDTRTGAEIMDALEVALASVGTVDRDLMMGFVGGETYEQLARSHGLTLGAVKARLHRIRPFLREYVGEATATRLPESRWGQSQNRRAA